MSSILEAIKDGNWDFEPEFPQNDYVYAQSLELYIKINFKKLDKKRPSTRGPSIEKSLREI